MRYMDKMEAVGRLLSDFPGVIKVRSVKVGTIYEAKVVIVKRWVDKYWARGLQVLNADSLVEQLRTSFLTLDDGNVEGKVDNLDC